MEKGPYESKLMDEIDIIIENLLHTKIPSDKDIKLIQEESIKVLSSQPSFVEIESPIYVCGDIHGQYVDLIRIFSTLGFPNKKNRYLFLGDYVDRGKNSLETICLLLCYKIKFPLDFYILRGNHESTSISRMYGFYDECKRKIGIKTWKTFLDIFNWLPITASIDDKILCMHGGISPELKDLEGLRKILRPTDIPNEGNFII